MNTLLLNVLRRVEHGGLCRECTTAQCPYCGEYGNDFKVRHLPDCLLARMIAELEKAT